MAVSGKAEGVGDEVSEGRSGAGSGRTLMLWALWISRVNIVVRTMNDVDSGKETSDMLLPGGAGPVVPLVQHHLPESADVD